MRAPLKTAVASWAPSLNIIVIITTTIIIIDVYCQESLKGSNWKHCLNNGLPLSFLV